MKRSRGTSSASSSSSLTRKVKRLPKDLRYTVAEKLPAYDQKLLNKEHYELQRLRALVYRDFFRDLVLQTRDKNMRVVFGKRDADAFEFKKVTFVSKALGSKSPSSDKAGEYTLNLRQVSDGNINSYASNSFDVVYVATSISCTTNVYPLVSAFAAKLFPRLDVRKLD